MNNNNKMNILFLDDNQNRKNSLPKHRHNFTLTSTAKETIQELESNQFHIISLDHDLGGKVFVSMESEDCGMRVVDWLVDNNLDYKPVIIVHSWNTPAAIRMTDRLIDAGYEVVRQSFHKNIFI